MSRFIGKYMALIVVIVAGIALFFPGTFLWVRSSWINPLLMIVMFGMGLTLTLEDFKILFVHPKEVLIGCAAQFTLMPLLAFLLARIFHLEAGLMAGVILVGTCPGGTSSNVMTYLAKGNVPLSVGMTSLNTLLAPVLTPAITYLLLGQTVSVDIVAMMQAIVKVVLIPILLGLVLNRLLPRQIERVIGVFPVISVAAITLIVTCVVSHNSQTILSTGAIVFVVVILHNLLGYGCGYLVAKWLHFSIPSRKAFSFEIGMQNSGLATSLAATAFPSLALATAPGAIFSVWHNISGAILANILRRIEE